MRIQSTALIAGVLAVATIVGFGNTAMAQGKLEQILTRGKLVVGTGVGNPPWHFRDEKGDMAGFDVDVAEDCRQGPV